MFGGCCRPDVLSDWLAQPSPIPSLRARFRSTRVALWTVRSAAVAQFPSTSPRRRSMTWAASLSWVEAAVEAAVDVLAAVVLKRSSSQRGVETVACL